MEVSMHRPGVAALLVGILVLAACTDGEPTGGRPTASAPPAGPAGSTATAGGLRLGLVYPPPDERVQALEAYRRDVDRVRRSRTSELQELRDLAPDSPVFRRDLLRLLAERGHDLVCAVGQGARSDLLAVASEFPAGRFCLVGGRISEPPSNVLAVDLAVEQAAMLAGAAAGRAAVGRAPPTGPASPDPSPPATVAFVAGAQDPRTERQRAGFTAGVALTAPGLEVVVDRLPRTPEDRAAATTDVVGQQVADGAEAVYVTEAVDLRAAVDAAGEEVPLLAGGRDAVNLPAGMRTGVLFVAVEQFSVGLAAALDRTGPPWAGGQIALGLADGAVDLVEGAHPRASGLRDLVEEVREGLLSGELQAPTPPVS